MAVIISTATTAQIADALCRVSRRRVVYCPSVGDAASPVWLVAGEYSRVVGQCADHGHSIDPHARVYDALVVEGWWEQEHGWVAGCPDAHADAVVDALRRAGHTATTRAAKERADAIRHRAMVADIERRERPAREAAQRAREAAVAGRREQLRQLAEEALAKCRTNRKGQPHAGDVRNVQVAYDLASHGHYDYDRNHWMRVLTRLAELGPTDRDMELAAADM